jgi:hypothetical protein
MHGIQCLFDPQIQDPEKVFSGSWISDPGSQPHIFENLLTILVNSLKIGRNFFLQQFKTEIICNFVKFVAT